MSVRKDADADFPQCCGAEAGAGGTLMKENDHFSNDRNICGSVFFLFSGLELQQQQLF